MQDVGRARDRAPLLAPLLNRFAALSAARTVFVELTFWAMLAALVIASSPMPADRQHDVGWEAEAGEGRLEQIEGGDF